MWCVFASFRPVTLGDPFKDAYTVVEDQATAQSIYQGYLKSPSVYCCGLSVITQGSEPQWVK